MTYLEAAVVGLFQGVSEMFPVSSLGHNVLIPALVGGQWAKDLNVATSESPYLAYIVGLHVATAIALIIYFWKDWIRIIGGLISSIRYREIYTVDQKLAWMLILATIPVGLAGLAFEHAFRVLFGQAKYAAAFLAVNGVILIATERFRRRSSLIADEACMREREHAELVAVGGRRSSSPRAERMREEAVVQISDRRLATLPFKPAILIGSAQILALLAGISRDGVTMCAGMWRGLSREDAARFAFLLATPVILAAGVLKIPDLYGPLGQGIQGQIYLGSLLSGIGAYVSIRFLVKYLRTRTLTPFGIYCLIFGLGGLAYLTLVK